MLWVLKGRIGEEESSTGAIS